MKYSFRILLALILAGITVFCVYYFTYGKSAQSKNDLLITTVSRAPATEKYANKRRLASIKSEGYTLYTTDENILLTHGDETFEFKLFSSYFDREKPVMYCFDVDGDKRRDVVIRGVSGEEQSTGDYVYDIYILRRAKSDKESYDLITASQDTWHNILDKAIKEEISQLKTCKKCVQFAMTLSSNNIEYDEKTGLAVKNAGYVGFFRALQNGDGQYMTVETWNKGKGSFFITKDKKIACEVEVIVKYKDYDGTQKAGTVYFEMHMNEEGTLLISSGSMVFRTNGEYKIADPTLTAKNKWTSTLNNSAKPKGSEEINWVKYAFALDSKTLTQTADLAKEDTDIKFINSVAVTESALTLTAKDGYVFDSETAKKNEFSVTINKGTDEEYEISYLAELSADGKTLKINFDKTYPQNAVKTVDISFGSK